jgi:hypothetical protein
MDNSEELTDEEREAVKLLSEISGSSERIDAKKLRIRREASRRLADMGGTMPDLEDIRRLRADDL